VANKTQQKIRLVLPFFVITLYNGGNYITFHFHFHANVNYIYQNATEGR